VSQPSVANAVSLFGRTIVISKKYFLVIAPYTQGKKL